MNSAALPVTILGTGQIGLAVALLLQRSGSYRVIAAGRDDPRLALLAGQGCETRALDLASDAALADALAGSYAVVNALPFHRALAVARLAAGHGVHYFDLTEDVKSARAIEALASGASTVLMPQCGLAPGFIGIVGHDLAGRFDAGVDLHLRVGALPRFPVNALRYNLTWSTEGLINQYCKPCEALVEGQRVELPALEGRETFVLDGVDYEAFNTSGGLGTLTRTLQGRARNVDYKSVRYPGHCALMQFLLNELRLRERPELLRQLLEEAVPATEQDVVLIFATAAGRRGGVLLQESYSARILGERVGGRLLSAIQRSTAAGVCTALDLVREGRLPQAGFIAQEQVPLAAFLANRFGRVYAEAASESASP